MSGSLLPDPVLRMRGGIAFVLFPVLFDARRNSPILAGVFFQRVLAFPYRMVAFPVMFDARRNSPTAFPVVFAVPV